MVIRSASLLLTLLLSVDFINTLHAATLLSIPNLLDRDTIEIEDQVIHLKALMRLRPLSFVSNLMAVVDTAGNRRRITFEGCSRMGGGILY